MKLTTDVLPVHDKIYVGAAETVAALLMALHTAVVHAQATWDSLSSAQRQETAEEKASRGGASDPTLMFQRIEATLQSVQQQQKTA